MSNEPIVHKEPPTNANPFAKVAVEHVNAGTVSIETERAIAEAQGKLVIAKKFPRDQARAYSNVMDACKRIGLAEAATYSFNRGGKVVSGPSIRLAETIAACWGNVDYGIRELSRKEGVSEMEAYCWDLETNTMSSQKFTVRHIRDKTGGGVKLTDERDIYEITANMAARRLRARIEAILPSDLVNAAVEECDRTLAGSNEGGPIIDKVRKMLGAFQSFGVPAAMIEKRLGHSLDSVLPEELADLRKIHNSLRDGASRAADWFGDDAMKAGVDDSNPDLEAAPAEENKRPLPKPRATRGAAAAKAAEVVVEQEPAKPEEKPAAEAAPQDNARLEADLIAREAKLAAMPTGESPEAKAAAETEKAKLASEAGVAAPRAFLNDGEEATFLCTVKSLKALEGEVDGKKAPSVLAEVTGGFNGSVRHFGGASADGKGAFTPNAPWAVGAELKLTLKGQKSKAAKTKADGTPNPSYGRVVAWVQGITSAEAAQGATEFGE